jgi:hypothetical protein
MCAIYGWAIKASMNPDFSPELNVAIRKRGFKHTSRARQPLGIRIWERNCSVVVVPSIRIQPSKISRSIEDAIEDYFRNLWDQITEQKPLVREVFFQGNGTILIPDWFLKNCERLGIKVTVFTGEDRPFNHLLGGY